MSRPPHPRPRRAPPPAPAPARASRRPARPGRPRRRAGERGRARGARARCPCRRPSPSAASLARGRRPVGEASPRRRGLDPLERCGGGAPAAANARREGHAASAHPPAREKLSGLRLLLDQLDALLRDPTLTLALRRFTDKSSREACAASPRRSRLAGLAAAPAPAALAAAAAARAAARLGSIALLPVGDDDGATARHGAGGAARSRCRASACPRSQAAPDDPPAARIALVVDDTYAPAALRRELQTLGHLARREPRAGHARHAHRRGDRPRVGPAQRRRARRAALPATGPSRARRPPSATRSRRRRPAAARRRRRAGAAQRRDDADRRHPPRRARPAPWRCGAGSARGSRSTTAGPARSRRASREASSRSPASANAAEPVPRASGRASVLEETKRGAPRRRPASQIQCGLPDAGRPGPTDQCERLPPAAQTGSGTPRSLHRARGQLDAGEALDRGGADGVQLRRRVDDRRKRGRPAARNLAQRGR